METFAKMVHDYNRRAREHASVMNRCISYLILNFQDVM
jgi:hypothetical protein